MRLNDADNVLKALGVFNDREHGDPHFLNGIETAREIVEQAPTIDAEPVRHGTWITKPNMYWRYVCIKDGSHTEWFNFLMQKSIINERPGWFFEETEGWECSECGSAGYGRPAMMFEKPKYCPNCGAKMDGGENDA